MVQDSESPTFDLPRNRWHDWLRNEAIKVEKHFMDAASGRMISFVRTRDGNLVKAVQGHRHFRLQILPA